MHSPIERPRCVRCGTRMNLTTIVPRPGHSEKRTFECPKCNFIETKVVANPLESEEIDRLTNIIGPRA
jgi:hypothetical protein